MAGTEGRAAAALALTCNAFVWGVSWWPFRTLQAQGLHPLWATAFIYLVALAALLAWRPRVWRSLAGQPGLLLLMASAGLTNVGFNWAVTVGDVVRVVLLFYLMPAWSVLLAWPLLGERPGVGALLRLALALVGVGVVLQQPGVPWPLPESLADWLALAGGFGFALTNILLRRLNHLPTEARIGAMFTGGAVSALAAGALAGLVGLAPAPVALPAGALALALALSVSFLAGNAALQYGAARLPAQTTALILLTELLFAAGSSVLAGSAELTTRTLLGGALIVAVGVWSAVTARHRTEPVRSNSVGQMQL